MYYFFPLGNLIEHLSPKNLSYTESNLMDNPSSLKFTDPLSEDDIKKDVLKTVIHSTLTSRNQPGYLNPVLFKTKSFIFLFFRLGIAIVQNLSTVS